MRAWLGERLKPVAAGFTSAITHLQSLWHDIRDWLRR